MLLSAIVESLRRAGVDPFEKAWSPRGPPSPTLVVSGTLLRSAVTGAVIGLSRGTGVVLGRCAQRAVGLDRLPQPRGIIIAAPRLRIGWIGLAVEVLCLLGYLDLRVLRNVSQSRSGIVGSEGHLPIDGRADKPGRNPAASRDSSVRVPLRPFSGSMPGPPMGMRRDIGSCWRR